MKKILLVATLLFATVFATTDYDGRRPSRFDNLQARGNLFVSGNVTIDGTSTIATGTFTTLNIPAITVITTAAATVTTNPTVMFTVRDSAGVTYDVLCY